MATVSLTNSGINRLFLTFSRFGNYEAVAAAGMVHTGISGPELTELGYRRVYQNFMLSEEAVPSNMERYAPAAIAALLEAIRGSAQFKDFITGNWNALSRQRLVEFQLRQTRPAPPTQLTAPSGAVLSVVPDPERVFRAGSAVAVAYVGEPLPDGSADQSVNARWFEGTVVHDAQGPRFLVDFAATNHKPAERCVVDRNSDEVVVGKTALAFIRANPGSILLSEATLLPSIDRRLFLYSNQEASVSDFVTDYESCRGLLGLSPLVLKSEQPSVTVRQLVDVVLPLAK